MLKATKEKLLIALEEECNYLRPKIVRLYHLRIDEDIAGSIINDHRSDDGIMWDCMILESIGAAECKGNIYTFEDGSAIEIPY